MSDIKSRIKFSSYLILVLASTWGLWQYKKPPHLPENAVAEAVKAGSSKKPGELIVYNTRASLKSQSPSSEAIAEAARKISIINEILTEKNDNDSRLDSEFKNLTALEKEAIQEKYKNIKPENRNDRGTLVFLLGRQLETPRDFEFLKTVLSEAPCTNLLNCNSAPAQTSSHEHASGEIEITLEYPQIVALKAIETYLMEHPKTAANQEMVHEILKEAIHSKNQIASNLALSITRKY